VEKRETRGHEESKSGETRQQTGHAKIGLSYFRDAAGINPAAR
jgi:hypothetical protein